MRIDSLLSTIILVTFLITVILAVGSYAAYKVREGRRPRTDVKQVEGEASFFERVHADDIAGPAQNETHRG